MSCIISGKLNTIGEKNQQFKKETIMATEFWKYHSTSRELKYKHRIDRNIGISHKNHQERNAIVQLGQRSKFHWRIALCLLASVDLLELGAVLNNHSNDSMSNTQ